MVCFSVHLTGSNKRGAKYLIHEFKEGCTLLTTLKVSDVTPADSGTYVLQVNSDVTGEAASKEISLSGKDLWDSIDIS